MSTISINPSQGPGNETVIATFNYADYFPSEVLQTANVRIFIRENGGIGRDILVTSFAGNGRSRTFNFPVPAFTAQNPAPHVFGLFLTGITVGGQTLATETNTNFTYSQTAPVALVNIEPNTVNGSDEIVTITSSVQGLPITPGINQLYVILELINAQTLQVLANSRTDLQPPFQLSVNSIPFNFLFGNAGASLPAGQNNAIIRATWNNFSGQSATAQEVFTFVAPLPETLTLDSITPNSGTLPSVVSFASTIQNYVPNFPIRRYFLQYFNPETGQFEDLQSSVVNSASLSDSTNIPAVPGGSARLRTRVSSPDIFSNELVYSVAAPPVLTPCQPGQNAGDWAKSPAQAGFLPSLPDGANYGNAMPRLPLEKNTLLP